MATTGVVYNFTLRKRKRKTCPIDYAGRKRVEWQAFQAFFIY